MIFALKILGALLALGLGVWLGLPGRYSQPIEEIEEAMERGGGGRPDGLQAPPGLTRPAVADANVVF